MGTACKRMQRIWLLSARTPRPSRTSTVNERALCTALAQTTVLYDSGCPLCVWEIGHYKKLDAEAQRIRWLDVRGVDGQSPEQAALAALESVGSSPEKALKQLHVISSDGSLHLGADAFPALWDNLPYFRKASPAYRAAMSHVPGFRPLVERGYTWFVGSAFRRKLPELLAMAGNAEAKKAACKS